MEERIELLKAMDFIIINLDDDNAYAEWWNGMYAISCNMHLKKWREIAGNDDDFLTLCALFRDIMSKCTFSKFVLEDR